MINPLHSDFSRQPVTILRDFLEILKRFASEFLENLEEMFL